MFAVIRLGNQQFKVQAGDYIRTPFLKTSEKTMNPEILAVGSQKGLVMDSAELKTAKVDAQVLRDGLAKKIIVFKKKRRKGYRNTRGHRQKFTELHITQISLGTEKSVAKERPKKAAAKKTVTATKATATKKKVAQQAAPTKSDSDSKAKPTTVNKKKVSTTKKS